MVSLKTGKTLANSFVRGRKHGAVLETERKWFEMSAENRRFLTEKVKKKIIIMCTLWRGPPKSLYRSEGLKWKNKFCNR